MHIRRILRWRAAPAEQKRKFIFENYLIELSNGIYRPKVGYERYPLVYFNHVETVISNPSLNLTMRNCPHSQMEFQPMLAKRRLVLLAFALIALLLLVEIIFLSGKWRSKSYQSNEVVEIERAFSVEREMTTQ